jgi:hypothetical protein
MTDERVAIVFLIIIGVILLGPFLLSLRRTSKEAGLKPIYEDRAIVFFRHFAGGNLPWWRLSCYDNFMVISGGLKSRLIPYEQISGIYHKRFFLFFKPLYLEYKSNDTMKGFYMFLRDSQKILELIQSKKGDR